MAKQGYLDTRNGNEISKSFLKGLKQKLYYAPKPRKMELLNFILRKRISGKVIVFRRTTFGTEETIVCKTYIKFVLKKLNSMWCRCEVLSYVTLLYKCWKESVSEFRDKMA